MRTRTARLTNTILETRGVEEEAEEEEECRYLGRSQ